MKKNKAELGYYSLACAAVCFGPRSKSVSWAKTASRDFCWDRSPFVLIAQAHRKRCSATKDFVVLLKQHRKKGQNGKMKATRLVNGFDMGSLVESRKH